MMLNNLLLLFVFVVCDLNCKKLQSREIFGAKIDLEEELRREIGSCGSFFSKFFKDIRLFHNKNYIYYISKNTFYYFDFYTKKIGQIKIDQKIPDIYTCSFDGNYLYLATSSGIFVFDLNGNITSTCEFLQDCPRLIFYPKDIVVSEDLIYLISFDNKIALFNSEYKNDSKLKLIWLNNDLYNHVSVFNFKCIFQDEKIYILNKNRVCILNAFTGKVIKNLYLDKQYDDLMLDGNKLVLYTNISFAHIDLTEFTIQEDAHISFNNQDYFVDQELLSHQDKNYDFLYIKRFLKQGFYFAYRNSGKNCVYFLINNEKIEDNKSIKNFNISYVFFYENKIILIDVPHKKFKII